MCAGFRLYKSGSAGVAGIVLEYLLALSMDGYPFGCAWIYDDMVSRYGRARDLDERSAAYGMEDNTLIRILFPVYRGCLFDYGIPSAQKSASPVSEGQAHRANYKAIISRCLVLGMRSSRYLHCCHIIMSLPFSIMIHTGSSQPNLTLSSFALQCQARIFPTFLHFESSISFLNCKLLGLLSSNLD